MSNNVLYTEILRCPECKHQQSAEYITERGKEEAFPTLGTISNQVSVKLSVTQEVQGIHPMTN